MVFHPSRESWIRCVFNCWCYVTGFRGIHLKNLKTLVIHSPHPESVFMLFLLENGVRSFVWVFIPNWFGEEVATWGPLVLTWLPNPAYLSSEISQYQQDIVDSKRRLCLHQVTLVNVLNSATNNSGW